jgi:hypothetical protein
MKKFYSLALFSAMLLLGCTADGVFDGDPREINWSKDALVACSYNGECSYRKREVCDDLPGTVLPQCPDDNGTTGSCSIYGACGEDFYQDACSGVFSLNGQCNIAIYEYCAYNRDCDLIGGEYTTSKASCLNRNDSFFATREYCEDNDYRVYNN